jgi:hypothetical protein
MFRPLKNTHLATLSFKSGMTEEPDKNSSLNDTPVDVGVLDGDGHHEATDEEHAGGLHEVHARLGCRHYS